MNRIHELKIERRWADDILYFGKSFEVRKNDRNFQKGDRIQFNVLEEGTEFIDCKHPLGEEIYEIEYVHEGLGMEKGYAVLAIKRIDVA